MARHFFPRAHVFSTLPVWNPSPLPTQLLCVPWIFLSLSILLEETVPRTHWELNSTCWVNVVSLCQLLFMGHYCWRWFPPACSVTAGSGPCEEELVATTVHCRNQGQTAGSFQSALNWSNDPRHWGVQIISFAFLATKSTLTWETNIWKQPSSPGLIGPLNLI